MVPAQVTTAAISEATLVTEGISGVLEGDLEAEVAGGMTVATELGKLIGIIEAQGTTGRHRSVMTVAAIAIDGNETNPSEAVDHRHPLPEAAHRVIAVANQYGMPRQVRMWIASLEEIHEMGYHL